MKQLTAQQIAEMIGGKLVGDPNTVITDASSLETAKQNQITFLGSKKYLPQLSESQAGIILVNKDLGKELFEGHNYIICDDVDVAFSRILIFFAPEPITYAPGIHPSAVIDPSVSIGQNVYIGANAVHDHNN